MNLKEFLTICDYKDCLFGIYIKDNYEPIKEIENIDNPDELSEYFYGIVTDIHPYNEDTIAVCVQLDTGILEKRIEIVKNALNVCANDAVNIIEHLEKHNHLDWIDDYDETNKEAEAIIDVHYEDNFEDMINWLYENAKPSEMLGMSNYINDYPEMLRLETKVIFWYNFD